MLLFGMIFVGGLVALLLVQAMDVECERPAPRKKIAIRRYRFAPRRPRVPSGKLAQQ